MQAERNDTSAIYVLNTTLLLAHRLIHMFNFFSAVRAVKGVDLVIFTEKSKYLIKGKWECSPTEHRENR